MTELVWDGKYKTLRHMESFGKRSDEIIIMYWAAVSISRAGTGPDDAADAPQDRTAAEVAVLVLVGPCSRALHLVSGGHRWPRSSDRPHAQSPASCRRTTACVRQRDTELSPSGRTTWPIRCPCKRIACKTARNSICFIVLVPPRVSLDMIQRAPRLHHDWCPTKVRFESRGRWEIVD